MSNDRDKRVVITDPQRLESIVGHVVRNQPQRRAPVSLSERVLAQLAVRHANLPWWRRGFGQWPLAARASFLIASYGFMRLALAGVMSLGSFVGSREAAGTAISWVDSCANAMSALAAAGSSLLHAIPSTWLYGAAAAGFALYAVLFGLGTVAYRTLCVER